MLMLPEGALPTVLSVFVKCTLYNSTLTRRPGRALAAGLCSLTMALEDNWHNYLLHEMGSARMDSSAAHVNLIGAVSKYGDAISVITWGPSSGIATHCNNSV